MKFAINVTSKDGDNINIVKKIEKHSFILGAIGSTVSGLVLILAAYSDYGRLYTKFFMGYWTTSGMFHPQRTWLIYLLILALGLILAEIGHRKFNKIYRTKSSYSFIFTILTIILLIFSSCLLAQANPINHRGEVVPYWGVCLFEELNTGILFSALTLSILFLLGISQISLGKTYHNSHQKTKNPKLVYITGRLHSVSGIILLCAIFLTYVDLGGLPQFHFLLFIPFLVTQITTALTFLKLRKNSKKS